MVYYRCMKNNERAVVYDNGQLFRVEHQQIPGRDRPYEFVRRIGATVVLPITQIEDRPHVVGIHNTRAYYGPSLGLPSGNAEGRFAHPEHPARTGLRELQEETGYGYAPDHAPNVDVFRLRAVSNTILYDRHFAVARDVEHIGGELYSPREVVDLRIAPLEEYLDPLFAMKQGALYPEVNLSLAKAAREVGHDETLDWIVNGGESPYADEVIASFEPWMERVA